MTDQDITQLLLEWREGSDSALEQLTPLVYNELKRLARRAFSGESAGHTLQPTVLVNEVFERLIGKDIEWQDRSHFFALSSRLMRRILVNHAKAKNAAKRGSGALRITMQDFHGHTDANASAEIIALDDAIKELATFDERKAKVIELHYFAGMTYQELAAVMNIAESTVHQDLRTAKAWLHQRMADQ